MILEGDPQRLASFLAQFRSLAGWSESEDVATEVRSLFATASDAVFPGAVLPRRHQGGLLYYALADCARDWRNLSPLLKAFVGITVTDFSGLASPMNADDDLEAWLSAYGFNAIARLEVGPTESHAAIADAGLVRLCEILHAPDVPERVQLRSTNQLLEDLRMALAVLDRTRAEEVLTFLRTHMRLDAMNLRFLEVQILAAFADWAQLRGLPFFAELCYTRRPPSVTAAMVEAIYHTSIEPVELTDGPAQTLEVLRSEVLPNAGAVFATCPPFPTPAVAKVFLLATLASEHVDMQAVERLGEVSRDWPEEEARSFDAFLALVSPPQSEPVSTPTFSWSALLDQLDLAGDDTAPVNVERARTVLLAATAVQTLDAYRVAVEYTKRLPVSKREALLSTPGYGGLWADISRHAGKQVPHSWTEWLDLLPDMTFEQTRIASEKAVIEWPIAKQLTRPTDVAALVQALGSVPPPLEERLFEALPDLVSWVQSDYRWPNPDYLALYQRLATLFVLSDRRSINALQALALLLDGLLTLGMPAPAYQQLLDDIGELVMQLSSVQYIDWLIDLAEFTTTYSCPYPAAREALWARIIAAIGPFASRLSSSQVAVLDEVAKMLGVPDTLADVKRGLAVEPVVSVAADFLRGFFVAVYTLTESVGQRVARTLRNLYPGIRVELAHDKTAGQRLGELARHADLFVICWRSAKHAATDAIRVKRPSDLPTVYASGKGSSSILADINRHLSQDRS